MDRRQANELDNYITGHYGEDQLRDEIDLDGLVYLAAPYSDPSENKRNLRREVINQVTADLIKMGNVIFSPITHNAGLALIYDMPVNFSFWEEYDRLFVEKADTLVVLNLPGWKDSRGVTQEIAWAKEQTTPIVHLDPWGLTWDLCQQYL